MGSNGNGEKGKPKGFTLTRRDFLKTTAAAAAAGGLLDATAASPAMAVENPTPTPVAKTTMTTCLCCSVGCGQLVDTAADGTVLDVYGDPNHVVNAAANCPKGAAAILNVTGDRRLGMPNTVVTDRGTTLTGGPWKRTGNGAWTEVSWTAAMNDIAKRLISARDTFGAVPTTTALREGGFASDRGVAWFGCSHATNEENYTYRKIIADFGSNNVEHQARI
jgi:anaerobic selenocysteine-containing dehydrogenase